MRQNFFKIIFVIILFIFLVIAFAYFQEGNKQTNEIIFTNKESITEKREILKEDDVKNETLEESEVAYNSWLDEREELIDKRLDFNKDILFIAMLEMNVYALKEAVIKDKLQPYQATFNKDTKSIYFYNDRNLPTKDDNLLVLHQIYNADVMLEQRIFKGNNQTKFELGDIDLDTALPGFNPIYQEGRLFRSDNLLMKVINDNGDIEISTGENVYTIKVGEIKIIEKKDVPKLINGKKNKENIEFYSKLIIGNEGYWNSKNMKYIVKYKDIK